MAGSALAQTDNPRAQIPNECSTVATCTPPMDSPMLNGPQQCVNYYSKKTVIKANWKKNRLDGAFFCADDNGLPMVEATFTNGEFDGEVRRYVGPRQTGQQNNLWSTQKYRHGKREGLYIVPRADDGKRNVQFFVNDARHGYELLVNADGSIDRYFNCNINGQYAKTEACADIAIPGFEKALSAKLAQEQQKHRADANQTVTQRYANGQISKRYTLADGKYEGLYEIFSTNGRPLSTANYKNGKRHGPATEYDKETGALTAKLDYVDNEIQTFSGFYLNGKPSINWKRDNGNRWLLHYRAYYDDGAPKEEGTRIIGEYFDAFDLLGSTGKQGECREYGKDGTLKQLSNYDKGRRNGLTVNYEYDELIVEDRYSEGKLKERKIRDRKNEAVLRKIEYAPDGSRLSDEKYPSRPGLEQKIQRAAG